MRGGKRQGAGRPPGTTKYPDTKMRSLRLTDTEYQLVKEYVKKLRSGKNE